MPGAVTLKSGETLTRPQAVERLKLLSGAWSSTDCEELCAHEMGDALTLLLFVLGVA